MAEKQPEDNFEGKKYCLKLIEGELLISNQDLNL
jgi:hypothetical protein